MKADDVTPGSEMANIIGKIYFCIYYKVINLADCREGNGELQVVAEATRVLAHAAKLQPIHGHL